MQRWERLNGRAQAGESDKIIIQNRYLQYQLFSLAATTLLYHLESTDYKILVTFLKATSNCYLVF